MRHLAQKMKSLELISSRTTPLGSLFGQAGSGQVIIDETPIRAAMWPCIHRQDPELAMGIWSLLAHLLGRWSDVRVYRLFARMTGVGASKYEFTPDDIQFSPDEWRLEELGENAGIWGMLSQDPDGKWLLKIYVDATLIDDEDEEIRELALEADDLEHLIGQLPHLAEDVAALLGASKVDESFPALDTSRIEDQRLRLILKRVLHWELRLIALLAGVEWSDDAFLADLDELIHSSSGSRIESWIIGRILGRTLLPGFSVVGHLVANQHLTIVEAAGHAPEVIIPLADGLYKLGYAAQAYELLEDNFERSQSPLTAFKLAELYLRSGRIEDAVDLMQETLASSDAGNEAITSLMRLYVNTMILAQQGGFPVQDYLFTDQKRTQDDALSQEIIGACTAILEKDPDDIEIRYKLLLQLAGGDAAQFWQHLREMLLRDLKHLRTRDAVNLLLESSVDDLTPAEEIFKEQTEARPEDAELRLGYAAILVENTSYEEARAVLLGLIESSDDLSILADAEKLLWQLDNPDFERDFGEISALIDAGKTITNADIDYLEELVASAPHFSDAYLTLARAYLLQDDAEAAVEVLLDAQKNLGDDPDLLELLGAILWEQGADDLAIEYLNKGLDTDPNHLRLLVRMGRCLFENGQPEDARLFLLRAEALNNRDPFLNETRAYIAKNIIQRKQRKP